MPSVSETIVQAYRVRREVSQTPDLATFLLARLLYAPGERRPAAMSHMVQRLNTGPLRGVEGGRAHEFAQWLREYLLINETVRGITFYPIHPLLALPDNGEGARVEGFIEALINCFTVEERDQLVDRLWSETNLPPFERTLHTIVQWQLDGDSQPVAAAETTFRGCTSDAPATSAQGILLRTKDDLLALSGSTTGVQAFVAHAGRLLAFAVARYLLAQADVELDLPIYAAPAADTHEGVKTLAHEIIEVHRARFADALRTLFQQTVVSQIAELGFGGEPEDEAAARELGKQLFHYNAKLIPNGGYDQLREEHGSFAGLAYYYYWARSGAAGRFLRQLHATHLNLAKKAGFANARSQYSQWNFYWLAPSLIETLLLVTHPRLGKDRILVASLLQDWYDRYGIALVIDERWSAAYRRNFRGLGSPEALNEANQRRFTEILAERGRLYKNSDDFPWVILKD